MPFHMTKSSIRALTTSIGVAGLLAVSAGPASAATNGQQVAVNFKYSYCPMYGPATNVVITGQNQTGSNSTWSGGDSVFPNGSYIHGWWWRGQIAMTWRNARTGANYRTTAFIPQWDDKTFQMWPDIVTVDCKGSLRAVSTRVTTYATGGGVWACGGWRNGAGLKETIYFSGYDEYQSENTFTYGIAAGGLAPAIVTWKGVAPNC